MSKSRPKSQVLSQDPTIRELLAENLKLQSQIVKLEIKVLSLTNKVTALEKEIEQRASEKYMEAVGKIMQRAGNQKARSRKVADATPNNSFKPKPLRGSA